MDKVTDIEITRIYTVYCDEHGYIDEPVRYADAILCGNDGDCGFCPRCAGHKDAVSPRVYR